MAATRVLNNILICLLFRFFSEYAGEQTGHDPIESASLCSADDGTKSASVVDTPARCLADDEDQKSNPLDIPQTHQTPSLPTGTYAVDGSYPTYQADSISNREISCGIVTEMLFSVNPLLKARWQPKSTVYALSAIGFWSSLHRQESLVV
ncbi:hypothetical protein BGZ75_003748 [Mortierella antarctica]|nr:hypothetical protein BGZ75_003748 [Mortierella antarctica]